MNKAKVSKATIYRRWSTKEELAIAAFDQLPLIECKPLGNLELEILDYVNQYRGFLTNTSLNNILTALVSEAQHNKVIARRLSETVTRRRQSGIDMIQRAIERGELPEGTNAELIQELIIGPMLHRSMFNPADINDVDYMYFAKLIIAGAKAVGSTTSK